MAREPRLGAVKTRLAAGVGPQLALELYEAMLQDTARAARRFAALGPNREVLVLVAGQIAPVRRLLGPDLLYGQQQGGHLGPRLEQAFVRARGEGVGPMLVCATDCPSISSTHLERVLDFLRQGRAAVLPSPDGGYNVLGLPQAALVPGLFATDLLDGAAALTGSLSALLGQDFVPALLGTLRDVDTVQDALALLEAPQLCDTAIATTSCLRRHAPFLKECCRF